MANVETNEAIMPIRYLFRRRLRDSGGAGRFRGGTGVLPMLGSSRG
jgi:N-methylhydantoinase B